MVLFKQRVLDYQDGRREVPIPPWCDLNVVSDFRFTGTSVVLRPLWGNLNEHIETEEDYQIEFQDLRGAIQTRP